MPKPPRQSMNSRAVDVVEGGAAVAPLDRRVVGRHRLAVVEDAGVDVAGEVLDAVGDHVFLLVWRQFALLHELERLAPTRSSDLLATAVVHRSHPPHRGLTSAGLRTAARKRWVRTPRPGATAGWGLALAACMLDPAAIVGKGLPSSTVLHQHRRANSGSIRPLSPHTAYYVFTVQVSGVYRLPRLECAAEQRRLRGVPRGITAACSRRGHVGPRNSQVVQQ